MARSKKKGIVKIAVALAVLAAAAAGIYVFVIARKSEPAELVGVKIEKGDVERVVSCTGTLSAVETVDVGAQVSGTITKVHVDYNDTVSEGQILLELDTELLRAEVKEAKAQVKKARAELEKSKADLDRTRKLFEKGYATDEERIAAETQVDVARATLDSAQASGKRASVQLGYAVIRSPIDGKVLARNVEQGQTIASSFNTPSLFILAADLSEMKIEARVDESDIGLISEGQLARFTVQAYPDRVYEGKVRQVRFTPETVQNVVKYTVVVDVSNEDGTLLPGMTTTVDFVVDARHDVLLLPNKALSFKLTPDMLPSPGPSLLPFWAGKTDEQPPPPPLRDGMARVWVLEKNGPPRPVDVTAGITDGSVTEVVAGSGLSEGMTVVTGQQATGEEEKKSRKRLFGPPRGGPPM